MFFLITHLETYSSVLNYNPTTHTLSDTNKLKIVDKGFPSKDLGGDGNG